MAALSETDSIRQLGHRHFDYITPEYAVFDKPISIKFEVTRGIGWSFGYNRLEDADHSHALSSDELIDMFVDIVSKNGNLILNVGPMADGTIPGWQAERLNALGTWLKVNGEAIYKTRPCTVAEGTIAGDPSRVRFTCAKNGSALYATILDKPWNSSVAIQKLVAKPGTEVTLLGRSGNLEWTSEPGGTRVKLSDLSGDYAWSLKFSPPPEFR